MWLCVLVLQTTFLRLDAEVATWYKEHGIAVLAWECLSKGFCAGRWTKAQAREILRQAAEATDAQRRVNKSTTQHQSSVEISQLGIASTPQQPELALDATNSALWREYQCVAAYCTSQNFERRERARELSARQQNHLSAAQVALRFVVDQEFSVLCLIGTTSVTHLLENVEAMYGKDRVSDTPGSPDELPTLSKADIEYLRSGCNDTGQSHSGDPIMEDRIPTRETLTAAL